VTLPYITSAACGPVWRIIFFLGDLSPLRDKPTIYWRYAPSLFSLLTACCLAHLWRRWHLGRRLLQRHPLAARGVYTTACLFCFFSPGDRSCGRRVRTVRA